MDEVVASVTALPSILLNYSLGTNSTVKPFKH